MANTEIFYLQLCTRLIEKKLKWINSQEWKQRDYLYLIDLIEDSTGISLSLSTVKRIWKKENTSIPHPATLDALAQFLGFEDWMHFKKSKHDAPEDSVRERNKPLVRKIIVLLAIMFLTAVVFVLIIKIEYSPREEMLNFNPDTISFSCSYSASGGVPNTVIFHYNVEGVEADSFSIQQSWDELQREKIRKTDKNLTSIYYYPGYHQAKLIANDSIIKQTDVRIYTEDWLAVVRDGYMDQMPLYIRNTNLVKNQELHVTKAHLDHNQILVNQNTVVSYYYVTDFAGLSSSNFRFKTRVRCDSIFNFTCPHVTICILGEENMNFVPLTTRGCVGYMNVKMGDAMKYGRNHDFSSFGVDIYKWQELEVQVANKVALVFLNGEQILELPFQEDVGSIVGFNINFSGSGAIDYIQLEDKDGEMVYNTEFDTL